MSIGPAQSSSRILSKSAVDVAEKCKKTFCEDDKGPKDWLNGQTAQRTVNSHNES
jgi:hypothetical protein